MTILDTTALSNFAATGQLQLLRSVLGTILIPLQVEDEIHSGLQEGHRHLESIVEVFEASWVEIRGDQVPDPV